MIDSPWWESHYIFSQILLRILFSILGLAFGITGTYFAIWIWFYREML